MSKEKEKNRHIVISIVEREHGLEMSCQVQGFDDLSVIEVLEFNKQQIMSNMLQKMEDTKPPFPLNFGSESQA